MAQGLPAEGMEEPREIPIPLAHLEKKKKLIALRRELRLERGEGGNKLLVHASRQDFHYSLFSHAVFTGSVKVLMSAALSSAAAANTVSCSTEFFLCNET